MPSKGAGSNPASTASARVTVKSAAGSKFMLRSRSGDCVVECGADWKSVVVSITPKGMPCDVTVEDILVIRREAVNGLFKETVTWLMLFSRPVVGRTELELSGRIRSGIQVDHTFESGTLQKIRLHSR